MPCYIYMHAVNKDLPGAPIIPMRPGCPGGPIIPGAPFRPKLPNSPLLLKCVRYLVECLLLNW